MKVAHNFGFEDIVLIVFRCYISIETEVNTEICINSRDKPVEFGSKRYLLNAFR